MSQKKTLVVILCMHRCGSSLTARLLQRLGMSLGPFELGEANESNKYGHFEAQPFVLLNRELQLEQFGFEGDLPDDAETLQRYRECDGRWSAEFAITDDLIARGRDWVERLMQSGDVCGFKDPRTVLTWPYWQRVFATLPELKIVPLVLLRGPHEIAMSMFHRSQGDRDYAQALDVTAVHYRRMKEIVEQWPGPSACHPKPAIVRFDPQVYAAQVRQAAEVCGLGWSDTAVAECYDASCRHFAAVPIDHPAQAAFDALAGMPANQANAADLCRVLADAATREAMIRQTYQMHRIERDTAVHENAFLRNKNEWLQARADMVQPLENQLSQVTCDLALIRGSRTWCAHETLAAALRFTRRDQQGAAVASRTYNETASEGKESPCA